MLLGSIGDITRCGYYRAPSNERSRWGPGESEEVPIMVPEFSPTPEQTRVIQHTGSHARLLAGPGTGKTFTITQRGLYLIEDQGVDPASILVLTFTRAAAAELRRRIRDSLGEGVDMPRVSTLHSFALRQLLQNSGHLMRLPRPLRIANDWEERYIIQEDLKGILDYDLDQVRERFHDLSSDWRNLDADDEAWEDTFPDARFLGAWRQHRSTYGYTLRSELVYQLKKGLEQGGRGFELESGFTHLLVDEYQDLNACDLAVIQSLRDRGIEVFGAGDDDQSIYGFRNADPAGIRRFPRDFDPCTDLSLETCMRCGRSIVRISQFVASLDPDREEKELRPLKDADEGEVHLLRFPTNDREAQGVAHICHGLIHERGYDPSDILILVRSDFQNAFSTPLADALMGLDVPIAVSAGQTPLETASGQLLLSYLNLAKDPEDSLALRSALQIPSNGVGPATISTIYDLALDESIRFEEAARRIHDDPDLVARGAVIAQVMDEISGTLQDHGPDFEALDAESDPADLVYCVRTIASDLDGGDDADLNEAVDTIERIVLDTQASTLEALLGSLSASLGSFEQAFDENAVNIMTMHQAKGLTAKAVIIIAAEEELLPGDATGDDAEDERRLLYVSLTRAKTFLAITHCYGRSGQQLWRGARSGEFERTLTPFLQDAPLVAVDGERFADNMDPNEPNGS